MLKPLGATAHVDYSTIDGHEPHNSVAFHDNIGLKNSAHYLLRTSLLSQWVAFFRAANSKAFHRNMEQSDESSENPQSEAMTHDILHDLSKDSEKTRFAGLYREDVVQGVSQPGVLGLVAKVAGDSDSDSSESENEEDKGADDETLSQGFARICWANSEESTHKIEDIKVVDRSFMHGDIVAKVSSPMGQTGMVTNVDLKVDLQLPTGDVITRVDSKTIRRVRPFVLGDYVIYDQWLGRVDEIYDNVTVMFEDGAKCKISCADPERLVPVSLSPMDDSECPFYPGQRVKASFTGVFKSARWLKGCWKPNRTEGTVINVEVDSVVIYWMAAASTGSTSETPGFPAERQTPKNLKRLMNFSHTTWQLGDRALSPQRFSRKGLFMPSAPSELDAQSDNEVEAVESPEQGHDSESLEVGRSTSASGKESAMDSWVAYRRKLRRRFTKHKKKALRKGDFYETALLIVGTKTRVDVLWQDGTRETGVDTCSLFPVDHVGDHDFWPEQHVMERGSDLDGLDYEVGRRAGIVKSVDSKQRTARVRWLLPMTHPQKWPSFEKEEVVSVYELIEHPDFDYCLGDVVIRLSPSVEPSNETTAVSGTVNLVAKVEKESKQEVDVASHSSTNGACETESNENVAEETEVDGKSAGEANVADLSWVGIITAIEDGQIEVAWADGEVSKVGSQAIYVVGRDEDDGSSQASAVEMDEEVDDAGSWTTMDSTDMHDGEKEQELGDGCEIGVCEGFKEGNETDVLMLEASGVLKQPDCADSSMSSQGSGSEKGLGSALLLPFTALIRALKFAASLLWALRGSKRQGDPPDQGMRVSVAQSESSEYGRVVSVGENELGTMGHVLEDATVVQPVRDNSPDNGTISGVSLAGEAQSGGAMVSVLSTDVGNDLGLEVGSNDVVQECSSPPTISATDGNLQASDIGFFKQFDSVKDTTDHHFRNEASQPSNQRRWSKKIQQEWAMLERCLPDTIFVRVYEDRMDLMRSVIVGASGTPYHDGLFFFDLFLPAEYPSSPPHVHYHSGGLRLNPNLYETGKVCLSLLNTWTGKGNEIWHSSSSSVLQVLVSIQGLVLNANPYFNEAGYDKQMGTAEGEKNSLAYVENSFLLSCKSMLYLLRRPPLHFEEFVKEHFKKRGPLILRACLVYMQGAPVGSLAEDGIVSAASGKDMEQSTVGFRLMLAKIIPRLIAAFKEVGAYCDAYEQQLTAIKG
ncbi:hypothetical protein GOP47_0016234 [Adiantum capillus-veneris]|uniref:E2 ubiquitin-conjugating enzyme n=1 Tax=Adiantum capillus-veneris TaxID=13818 RepID=A0A9D4UI53_ADICA|nr:hypothetical protein GOP47_0016234 [Adiantum capillus-veneris]